MRPFLAALILIVGTIPVGAQWLDRLTPGIPRTPRWQAEPHRACATRPRRQARFNGDMERASSRNAR
jgi:hypothetical protein